jgi:hypothetical protein
MKLTSFLFVVIISVSCIACTARPTIVPHNHWSDPSEAERRAAVSACESRVSSMGRHIRTRRSLNRSRGLAYNGGRAIGSGVLGQAHIGAIGQASAGLLSNYFGWLFTSGAGHHNHRVEMERCLMNSGYSVVGWN